MSSKPIPPDQQHIVLEVFGRTNNAYRWAGETDVFEASGIRAEALQRRPGSYRATWIFDGRRGRLAHRTASPGSVGRDRSRARDLRRPRSTPSCPDHSRCTNCARCTSTTALDYAENVANVPTVGYGGEIDPQLKASQSIQKAVAGMQNLKALFLVGPNTPHKWHPDSLKQSDDFIDAAVREGRRSPDRIHFVTYTTRYNQCFWLTVDALEQHYERAEVDGTRERVQNPQHRGAHAGPGRQSLRSTDRSPDVGAASSKRTASGAREH